MARRGGHRAIVSTAAAGQLGRMLARLCPKHGIEAIHIVRREPQVDILRQVGAGHILLSSAPDFEAQLKDLAGQLGADLVLDAVGGEMTGILLRSVPDGSRIVIYGWLSRQETGLIPTRLINDRVTIEGFFLGTWFRETSPLRTLPIILRAVRQLEGDLDSEIAERFHIEEAAAAVAAARDRATRGKCMLIIDPKEDRT